MPYRQTEQIKQKKKERKNSIVEAARKLFATKGYENTTVKDIVTEAGTSVGNYYFYFQSKEDLLFAISNRINEQVFRDIIKYTNSDYSPFHKIAIYVYIFTRHWYKNVEIARVLLQGKLDRIARNRILSIHRDKITEYLKGSDIVKEFPVDVLIAAIQGSWLNISELYLLDKDKRDVNFWAHKIIKFNLQGLGIHSEDAEQILIEVKDVIGITV